MRILWVSVALASSCWLGTWAPLLLLLVVAGVGVLYGRPWLLLLALAYGYGLLQLHHGLSQRLPLELEGHPLQFEAKVVALPTTLREFRFGQWRTRQLLLLDVEGSIGGEWPGRHRIRVNLYEPQTWVQAGDRLVVTVSLQRPRGTYNLTGMDLARADLARGIDARGRVLAWQRLSPGSGWLSWRAQLSASIQQSMSVSPAGSAVLPALVVGDRSGLPPSLWQQFQHTGSAHLLAISGLHIAIVAGWFWLLGRWLLAPLLQCCLPVLRRYSLQQLAWLPALLVALGYSALAGFSLPTVRALLMLTVVAGAQCWRQPVSLWRSLGLALLSVLLVSPLAVLSESLWLSFVAVAAIAALISCHSSRALVVLLPVLMAVMSAMLFGQWTLGAPLANLLLVPLYSVVVIPLALLGSVLQQQVLLEAAASGVELSAWLMTPLASWSRTAWLPSAVGGAFLILAALLLMLPALPFPRRLLPLLLLPWLSWRPPELQQGQWELTAFDVGQGLALAVRTHEHLLLYDTGASWPGGSQAQRIIQPWLGRMRQAPNLLVISHGDNDHAGGLADLPTAPMLSGEPERIGAGRACKAGQQWQWDEVRFTMLWPGSAMVEGNDASCVLLVEGAGSSVLLTGDISAQSEYRLLGKVPPLTLLVLAHHGSKSSTSAAWLRNVSADYALVSAGYRNRFHHPHPLVLERLAHAGVTVLRTDRDGMIVFRGGHVDNVPLITTWRHDHARPWHWPPGWRFW